MTAGWISAADDARAREVRNLAVDHTDRADQDVVPPGSSATSRAKESRWNLGYLASGRQLFASAARTSWEMNGMCSQGIRAAGEPCKYMLWGDRSSAPASERAGGKSRPVGFQRRRVGALTYFRFLMLVLPSQWLLFWLAIRSPKLPPKRASPD